MLVRKVSSVDELFPTLYNIGRDKKLLPTKLRGWVNILGLYVQSQLEFPGQDCRDSLAAGGKYRNYFYATCDYDLSDEKHTELMMSAGFGDFSHWKLKKFNQTVWGDRFAHLVVPTFEIGWYVSGCTSEDASLKKGVSFTEESVPKLMKVVNHFNSTGEWVGLYKHSCASCGQRVSLYSYFFDKPCLYCGGKIRD